MYSWASLARGLSASDAQLYIVPEDTATSSAAPQDGVGAVLRLPREAVT
jgi:hypothetical protein